MTTFDSSATGDVNRRIDALVKLSQNEEACKLLGVEGALEPQLDLSFIDDPLDWLAYDIAVAMKNADAEESGEEEEPGPTLATLVAEIKLYRIFLGEIDKNALVSKINEQMLEEA